MKKIAILLVLAAVASWAGWAWEHPLAHFLGIDTQQSQNYDFVSGVGPMIIAAMGFSGALATMVHHVNCHAPGCWRVGKYPLAGGQWKVCRWHHPDEEVRTGRGDLLAYMWRQHQAHRQLTILGHEEKGK